MNRIVEIFLRCYSNLVQDKWDTLLLAAEFSYSSARISSMGMSPFETDHRWNPKSPVDFLTGFSSQNESTAQFKNRLTEAFETARFSHKLAVALFSSYNSVGCTPHQYKVGDKM